MDDLYYSEKFHACMYCRAGVGRTGTFIAIWHLMESQQQCTPETVEATVKNLRKSRMSMVQTEVSMYV